MSPKNNRSFRNRIPVFMRDGWLCRYCGKDLLADGDALLQATVDHVMPVSLGGPNNAGNLVASCMVCNQLKGNLPAMHLDDALRLVAAQRDLRLSNILVAMRSAGQQFPRPSLETCQGAPLWPSTVTIDPETICPDAPAAFEQLYDHPAADIAVAVESEPSHDEPAGVESEPSRDEPAGIIPFPAHPR